MTGKPKVALADYAELDRHGRIIPPAGFRCHRCTWNKELHTHGAPIHRERTQIKHETECRETQPAAAHILN